MQIVIDIPEEVYKDIQSLDWKNGERWFSEEWKAIHNGTPCETVTEFADRCRECGAKYGKLLKQEPCEDAISRRAVLDQTYLWSKDEFLRVTNPFDYLRKRINSLPSVKPQEPKWIPVSERLPKISGWYLVTGSRGAISVRYWRKAIPQQGGSYWRGSVNPIAWMPLPEPYKAESEGQ